MTEVSKIEPRDTAQNTLPADPMVSMIERIAMDPNVPIDRLEKMMNLKERMEDRQRDDEARDAQRQFFSALAEAQNQIPVVLKNKANTQTKSRYADLTAIEAQAMPVIREHGFSVSAWPKPGAENGLQRVAFRVAHQAGHFDEIEDDFALDDRGAQGTVNKTQLHAKGSTVSYARRYLLTGYFNIATGDDDGNRGGGAAVSTITEDQFHALRDLIEKAGVSEDVVCGAEKISALPELPATRFDAVSKRLNITIRNKGVAK